MLNSATKSPLISNGGKAAIEKILNGTGSHRKHVTLPADMCSLVETVPKKPDIQVCESFLAY